MSTTGAEEALRRLVNKLHGKTAEQLGTVLVQASEAANVDISIAVATLIAAIDAIQAAPFITTSLSTALPNERQLVAGTGISLSDAGPGGSLAINATNSGTVTSVGLSMPSIFSVSGSPVTGSGTLAVALQAQAANSVWRVGASPGVPSFGPLAVTDLPAHNHSAAEITGGTLLAVRGGTGVSNTGTLTVGSNTTISGGGTLALAGFTLTVPATGTAALLAASNLFTNTNTIRSTSADFTALQAESTTASGAVKTILSLSGNTSSPKFETQMLGGSGSEQLRVNFFGPLSNSDIQVLQRTGETSQRVYGSATSAPSTVHTINQRSSGTPTAGWGSRLVYQGQSSTSGDQTMAYMDVKWSDATHATRKTELQYTMHDFGGTRTPLVIGANGTAPTIGFLGAGATTRQNVSGSRGGNAALASLLSALATLGLITDSTTA